MAGSPSGIASVGIGLGPVNWNARFCQPKPTTWLSIMITPKVKPISLTSPVASLANNPGLLEAIFSNHPNLQFYLYANLKLSIDSKLK
jgi:hypothetical protein